MPNKKTIAVTETQYKEIIETLAAGYLDHFPNDKVANALIVEANLGIRISDIVRLRMKDIIHDGNRHRLDIREKKTGKKREFTVPDKLYTYLLQYCMNHGISNDEAIFPTSERNIQKALKNVVDYLGYDNADRIGTHSFRKMYAQGAWEECHNLLIVQQLMQHSSPTITQRYLGVSSEELENVINKNLRLPASEASL